MQTPSTSGSPAFPHLFEPFTIGGARIRNRIVSSGHDTVMAVDGLVTDRLVAYQEARARGGAGLIVIQVAGVHPTARYTSSELTADTDESTRGRTCARTRGAATRPAGCGSCARRWPRAVGPRGPGSWWGCGSPSAR